MPAAGDKSDFVSGLRELRAEVAADAAGTHHGNTHWTNLSAF
jgi:hypothetical protein